MQQVISFPHMGNYHVPITNLLNHLFKNHIVLPAPPITKRTLELGSRYSPEFVCVPFKYNLGNYIEALENGANVLIQAGGGCRFGYYAEIQELILRDLGYDFRFIKLFGNKLNYYKLYRLSRTLGSDVSYPQFLYYALLTKKMIEKIDVIEEYIRENIGFETQENSFEHLQEEFLNELIKVNTIKSLNKTYKKYSGLLQSLPADKPGDCLKVGIVGELYTLMEPYSNYFIEKELAKNKIQVSRFITVSFILFEKPRLKKRILKETGGYLEFEIGADGTDSVAKSTMLAKKGYDGIIHIKPFGCTPEVNAMPMLQNIGKDYKIPILYFSFDSQTSETGIKTRLEAFYDMLSMRKGKLNCVQDF